MPDICSGKIAKSILRLASCSPSTCERFGKETEPNFQNEMEFQLQSIAAESQTNRIQSIFWGIAQRSIGDRHRLRRFDVKFRGA